MNNFKNGILGILPLAALFSLLWYQYQMLIKKLDDLLFDSQSEEKDQG